MRILVLSFYYQPDLCAGSFRATPLVAALRERAPMGAQIDVITTLPNRYATFNERAAEIERDGNVEVRRIRLPAHRSDMRGQALAFTHYARAALALVEGRSYDLVFATSSRLMTAVLGAWVARSQRAPLYLDIRDIFVDTIGDVLSPPLGWMAAGLLAPLESWTIRRANRINLVSRGFESYFKRRYGDRPFAWFTNGIDEEFLALPTSAALDPGGEARILYAGNIGEGQGLHEILPDLALALHGRARFIVIGDGGRRSMLEREIARTGADNVALYPPMRRPDLLAEYSRADVLFLHLGKHRALERVLPSKVFEYAALGKPLLAGVSGYTAQFIREEIGHAAVFSPGDVQQAVAAFNSLELKHCPRPAFIAKYSRRNIARAMADDILALPLANRTGGQLELAR